MTSKTNDPPYVFEPIARSPGVLAPVQYPPSTSKSFDLGLLLDIKRLTDENTALKKERKKIMAKIRKLRRAAADAKSRPVAGAWKAAADLFRGIE